MEHNIYEGTLCSEPQLHEHLSSRYAVFVMTDLDKKHYTVIAYQHLADATCKYLKKMNKIRVKGTLNRRNDILCITAEKIDFIQ